MLKITSTLFAATTSTDNLDLTYTTQSKEAEQLMVELNHGYATNDVLTMLPSRSESSLVDILSECNSPFGGLLNNNF